MLWTLVIGPRSTLIIARSCEHHFSLTLLHAIGPNEWKLGLLVAI